MRPHPLVLLLVLGGCDASLEHRRAMPGPSGVAVQGTLPAGYDPSASDTLAPGEILLVGQAGSTDVAVLQRLDERAASFVATGPASCPDCVAVDCSGGSPPTNLTRTVRVPLQMTTADPADLVAHATTTVEAVNFTSLTVDMGGSGSTWTPGGLSDTVTVDIQGTLPVCANFTYRFTVAAVPAPVDCAVSAWSSWSACDLACAGGLETRTRSVLDYPTNGGASCPVLEESRMCTTHDQACTCSLALDQNRCELFAGSCSWLADQCVPIVQPLTLCPEVTDQTQCDAEPGCLWLVDSCLVDPLHLCLHPDLITCDADPVCTWNGTSCLYDAGVSTCAELTTPIACATVELNDACTWDEAGSACVDEPAPSCPLGPDVDTPCSSSCQEGRTSRYRSFEPSLTADHDTCLSQGTVVREVRACNETVTCDP